jgi:hypothetical protein
MAGVVRSQNKHVVRAQFRFNGSSAAMANSIVSIVHGSLMPSPVQVLVKQQISPSSHGTSACQMQSSAEQVLAVNPLLADVLVALLKSIGARADACCWHINGDDDPCKESSLAHLLEKQSGADEADHENASVLGQKEKDCWSTSSSWIIMDMVDKDCC